MKNGEPDKFLNAILRFSNQWSHTGKARGPCLTPLWGDIPVKRRRIPPRPKAVVSCYRDEKNSIRP